jgi:hypothetical protein
MQLSTSFHCKHAARASRQTVRDTIDTMVVSHTEGSEGNWSFVLLQLVCYTLIRAAAAVADATKRLRERVREVSAVGVVAVEAAPREQEFGRACVVYRM